jgi:hypothetical protein
MEVKYKNTKSDVESAIHSLYINSFYRVSIFYSLFIILVAAITFVKEVKPSLDILYFIIAIFLIFFFRFYLIPTTKNKRYLKKQIEINPNYFSEEILCIKEEGFEVNSKRYDDPQFFNWQSVKYTYSTAKYYLIILHNEKLILINKTNSEPNNILPNIIGKIEEKKVSKKSNFNSNQHQNEIKNNKTLYWIGLLGIIPNVGLVVGVILSIIGIIRRDLKLIFIGIADILFTVVFWTILTQISESDFISKSFDKPKSEMTERNLNDLVKQIEFYKTANGKYPEKLKQIENKESFIFTNEIFETEKTTELYYKNENDKYILKSFGPDKKINTNDDIYPTLKIDSTKIGLRKEL